MHALLEPAFRLVGWLMVAAVVVGSLAPLDLELGIAHGDKWGHLVAYALLAYWWGMLHRSPRDRWLLCAAFVAMGVALEFAQGATGYRTCDPLDMAANAAGSLVGRLAVETPVGRLLPALQRRRPGSG